MPLSPFIWLVSCVGVGWEEGSLLQMFHQIFQG